MSSRARSSRWTTGSPGRSGSRLARLALAGLLLAGACLSAGQAFAEKRVALVIGNAGYQSGLPALKNPANDATDISAALRARGFDVLRGTDTSRAELQRLVDRFKGLARDADVSLFYYAGHAFQLSSQNYLVPIDAQIRKADDLAAQTLQLQSIVQGLEGTKGIHLVFLDACRNNPLQSSAGDSSGLQNGLARVSNAAGFLFVYATQPGNVAFDGGGRNSPFAGAVLSHIGNRGQDIGSMMINVRKDVISATGGFQIPWDNSSLTQQFYFVPGQPATASAETQLWQLAAGARDPSLLNIYLQRYPDGPHAAEVKALAADTKFASLPEVGTVRSTPTNDTASDDRLWELAQRARIRSLVEFYLTRNPDGRHATEARELLGSLADQDQSNAPPGQVCERLATHPRDATANNSGASLSDLAQNASAAIAACQKAREQSPELPHYTALLARALVAAGRREEGIRLYREAADRGNLRALVSLGLIIETGDGLPKDPRAATQLYEKAAAGGSPDGAINLAVSLMGGIGGERNPARAVQLLNQAAEAGSAIANFNLGVLAQEGVTAGKADALKYFERATELGEPRGFVPAAILLDEGRGVPKNPDAASDMLLRGVASDSGEALAQLTQKAASWSPATLKALQARLKRAGHYTGPIDGKGGAKLAEPLKRWRRVGSL